MARVGGHAVDPFRMRNGARAGACAAGVLKLNAQFAAGPVVRISGHIQGRQAGQLEDFYVRCGGGFAVAPGHEHDAAIVPSRPEDLAQFKHPAAQRLLPTRQHARRQIVRRAVHDAHETPFVVRIADNGDMRLADILDAPVDRPQVLETTALGAAYLAGLQAGLLPKPAVFAKTWKRDRRFVPKMKADVRAATYAGWKDAVRKLLA